MMKFTIKEYDSAKHILAIPDHYVAIARTAEKATAAGGMVVSEMVDLLSKLVLFILQMMQLQSVL